MSARESQALVSSIETFWHTAESSPSTAHPQPPAPLKLRGRRFDGGGDEDWYCCLIGRRRDRRALLAFVLSRIVGRFGFWERGWVLAPHVFAAPFESGFNPAKPHYLAPR